MKLKEKCFPLDIILVSYSPTFFSCVGIYYLSHWKLAFLSHPASSHHIVAVCTHMYSSCTHSSSREIHMTANRNNNNDQLMVKKWEQSKWRWGTRSVLRLKGGEKERLMSCCCTLDVYVVTNIDFYQIYLDWNLIFISISLYICIPYQKMKHKHQKTEAYPYSHNCRFIFWWKWVQEPSQLCSVLLLKKYVQFLFPKLNYPSPIFLWLD